MLEIFFKGQKNWKETRIVERNESVRNKSMVVQVNMDFSFTQGFHFFFQNKGQLYRK